MMRMMIMIMATRRRRTPPLAASAISRAHRLAPCRRIGARCWLGTTSLSPKAVPLQCRPWWMSSCRSPIKSEALFSRAPWPLPRPIQTRFCRGLWPSCHPHRPWQAHSMCIWHTLAYCRTLFRMLAHGCIMPTSGTTSCAIATTLAWWWHQNHYHYHVRTPPTKKTTGWPSWRRACSDTTRCCATRMQGWRWFWRARCVPQAKSNTRRIGRCWSTTSRCCAMTFSGSLNIIMIIMILVMIMMGQRGGARYVQDAGSSLCACATRSPASRPCANALGRWSGRFAPSIWPIAPFVWCAPRHLFLNL